MPGLTLECSFIDKEGAHCFAASEDGHRAISGANPMCLWDLQSGTGAGSFYVYDNNQVRRVSCRQMVGRRCSDSLSGFTYGTLIP